jgi:ubiquinol-cytochrome c reductase cytochrome c subunit
VQGLLRLAALLVLVLPAAAAAEPPPLPYVQSEQGVALYNANCLACHGPHGEGVPRSDSDRAGPPLRGVGAMSADLYVRTGYMPLGRAGEQPLRRHVFFSEQQIEALVQHVASFGGGPAIPTPHPERGDVAVGMRLFTDHCAGCHQVAAAGGYLTGARAPKLDQATPTQVAEAVRVGPYLMPRFSQRQISDRQLDSIIRYVEYAKHPDDRGGWSLGHVGPVPEGLVTWWIAMVALVGCCVLFGKRGHG